MMRLIALAALLSLACYMIFGRWPWDYLEGQRRGGNDLREARRLLGVTADATETEIRAAYRRKAANLHPDRGGDTTQIQTINAARDLLLAALTTENPET